MNKCNLFSHISSFAESKGEKKSLCALPLLIFPITLPWGSLSRWNARQWLSNVTDFKIFIYRNEVCTDLHLRERSHRCAPLPRGSREKLGQRWLERNLFVEQGENKKTHTQTATRADCQRAERHSSANLLKVCLVDVLLLWWWTYVHSSCATINGRWLCAS